MRILFAFFVWLSCSANVLAAEISIAVASNFAPTLEKLAAQFERQTDHTVRLSAGSTGKHYAQIMHGAPFDLFFAADVERPKKLLEQGIGIAESRTTYALGRLALWHPKATTPEQARVALDGPYRKLAIANPLLAPYGRAAAQTIERLGYKPTRTKLVRGENIAQTFQFVATGNADLGFVAAAQLKATDNDTGGGVWMVPDHLHDPIEQQALQISASAAAQSFMLFLRSTMAQTMIQQAGYDLPL